MIRFYLFIIILLALSSNEAQAKSVQSLDSIWNQIKTNAPDLAVATQDIRTQKLASQRQSLHWLPKAKLNSSIYSTNDPSLNLLAELNQRQITAADFNPAQLNSPNRSTYETIDLNVTLPIYEGGIQTSTHKALKDNLAASQYMAKSLKEGKFAQTAADYGVLLTAISSKNRMHSLITKTRKLLGDYELGEKSNPIGHAGFLSLKNLINKLEASENNLSLKINTVKESLSLKANIQTTNWQPASLPITTYLTKYFGKPAKAKELPSHVMALKKNASATEHMASAEKGKLLPNVGLFASNNTFNGTRDTGNSTTAGGYLQWNFFSPTDWLASKQKMSEARSLNGKATSLLEASQIENETSYNNIFTLKKNISILHQSLQLMNDQIENTIDLYNNGVVTILQVSEVLNNQANLITDLEQTEESLIMNYASNFLTQGAIHDI